MKTLSSGDRDRVLRSLKLNQFLTGPPILRTLLCLHFLVVSVARGGVWLEKWQQEQSHILDPNEHF